MPEDANNVAETQSAEEAVSTEGTHTEAASAEAAQGAEGTGSDASNAADVSGESVADTGHSDVGAASYGGTSSSDAVEMNSAELRTAAESGETAIRGLVETLEELKTAVLQTAEGWDSPGGDYFREVFVKRADRFEQALEELATYPSELIAFADDYEGVSSRAADAANAVADLAEQVKSANWSNVTGDYA